MKHRGPMTGVLLFYGAVVTVALILVLKGHRPGEGPRPASIMPVDLMPLVERTVVRAPHSSANLQLTYAVAGESRYRATLITTQRDSSFRPTGRAETHLSATLEQHLAPLVPRSPALAHQAATRLIREESMSELVPAGSPGQLELELGLGPQQSIAMSNVRGASPLSSITSGSLLLQELARQWSGSMLTSSAPRSQLRTIALLARMVRSRACESYSPVESCHDTFVLITPGAEPDLVEIDLGVLDRDNGRARGSGSLRLQVRTQTDRDGRLAAATLEVDRDASTARTPMSLYLAHPVAAGQMITTDTPGFLSLNVYPRATIEPVEIDLEALLAGSRWGS